MKKIISICLCCFNDLPYLKLLFKSIEKNTTIPYEICLTENHSIDGTDEWLLLAGKVKESVGPEKNKKCRIRWTHKNEGVSAVNVSAEIAKGEFLVWCNSDHYFLPNWDINILRYLKRQPDNLFSFNVIEPTGENYKYLHYDAGQTPDTFREADLLEFYKKNVEGKTGPNIISVNHPVACTRELWDKIGGVDNAYFPGWTSDIDWSKRAYDLGAKQVMVKNAAVYHFVSSTLKRKEFDKDRQKIHQRGVELFKSKFGMLPEDWKLTINDGALA